MRNFRLGFGEGKVTKVLGVPVAFDCMVGAAV